MNQEGNRSRALKGILLFVLLCSFAFSGFASEKEMRRVHVGLKLFPAIVAADYLVAEKKNSDGYLPLYILHENKPRLARDLAGRLAKIKNIKKIPIKVHVLTFYEFINGKAPDRSAVFIAQNPNGKIQDILKPAISSSILLFSPFKGDVEKGIHSGFIVSDRILPYINLTTMQQSRIQLKAFFLRVSKHYD